MCFNAGLFIIYKIIIFILNNNYTNYRETTYNVHIEVLECRGESGESGLG